MKRRDSEPARGCPPKDRVAVPIKQSPLQPRDFCLRGAQKNDRTGSRYVSGLVTSRPRHVGSARARDDRAGTHRVVVLPIAASAAEVLGLITGRAPWPRFVRKYRPFDALGASHESAQ